LFERRARKYQSYRGFGSTQLNIFYEEDCANGHILVEAVNRGVGVAHDGHLAPCPVLFHVLWVVVADHQQRHPFLHCLCLLGPNHLASAHLRDPAPQMSLKIHPIQHRHLHYAVAVLQAGHLQHLSAKFHLLQVHQRSLEGPQIRQDNRQAGNVGLPVFVRPILVGHGLVLLAK
jgi:hypothetical protein